MDGVIIANKPMGLTSSQICLRVKKTLRIQKVGHLGTLDPLATGVLPLCLNQGTKLVQFLLKQDKEYIGTMRLGIETDTHDSLGKVLKETTDVPQDRARIRTAFHSFIGEQFQTPPMFSAIKQNGVPLYKIARKGETVPRRQRAITVHGLDIICCDLPLITFRTVCSHGTYIRTLCHDIGRKLGCGAHLTALQRTRNGAFHIAKAVSLQDIQLCSREELEQKHLIAPREALNGMPEVVLDSALEHKVRNGAIITAGDAATITLPAAAQGRFIKLLSFCGMLIGVAVLTATPETVTSGSSTAPLWKLQRIWN